MSKDKIIRGPWRQAKVEGALNTPPIPAAEPPPAVAPPQEPELSEDQGKAISLILDGHTFILIAIRPTAGGADFLTALHGDHTDLRNAQPELPAVIERLYGRKGI